MSTPASAARGAQSLGDLSGTIVLVGAGKMGGAMLEGWLALGLAPQDVVAIEPEPAVEVSALAARGLRLNPPARDVGKASAIVLAVKPQVAPDVVPTLTAYLGATTVVLSIMAGPPIGFLEGALAKPAALPPALPNTPAAIRRALTVAGP